MRSRYRLMLSAEPFDREVEMRYNWYEAESFFSPPENNSVVNYFFFFLDILIYFSFDIYILQKLQDLDLCLF